MQQRINDLMIEARREGMNPRVASGTGYCSPAEQHRLYLLNNGTTNAEAWQSNHQYGVAVDIAMMTRDGSAQTAASDPNRARLGALGGVFQLEWGDHGYVDIPHFRWPGLPTWQDLQTAYARGAGVRVDQLTATITIPDGNGMQEVWRFVGAALIITLRKTLAARGQGGWGRVQRCPRNRVLGLRLGSAASHPGCWH